MWKCSTKCQVENGDLFSVTFFHFVNCKMYAHACMHVSSWLPVGKRMILIFCLLSFPFRNSSCPQHCLELIPSFQWTLLFQHTLLWRLFYFPLHEKSPTIGSIPSYSALSLLTLSIKLDQNIANR